MHTPGIGAAAKTAANTIQNASIRAIEARVNNLSPAESQVVKAQFNNTAAAQTATRNQQDPAVTELLEFTIQNAGTTFGNSTAFTIESVLGDSSLSQAQKDEYIARLVEISRLDNHTTLEGHQMTPQAASNIREAFEYIGDGEALVNGDQARGQLQDSIARSADNGRLSATDLHGLFNPNTSTASLGRSASSDGLRSLLTGITNGDTLDSLAGKLLTDAQRLGYDQTGPGVDQLLAAADVANMAAANGRTRAANLVMNEIGRHSDLNTQVGDRSLVEQLLAVSTRDSFEGRNTPPGHSAVEVLSTLINAASTSTNTQRQRQADELFATLVRSADGEYSNGLGSSDNQEIAFNQLGEYFNANITRLVEGDWRNANPNSGLAATRVVQDFVRNVLLDPSFSDLEATADAITDEMFRLSNVILNESLPPNIRQNAAATFGVLLGSIQEGGRQYVADARGNAQTEIDNVRVFTDFLTSQAISKIGGPVGGPIGNLIVGQGTDRLESLLVDRAENIARNEFEETGGPLVEFGQILRSALNGLDDSYLGPLDDRLDQFYDGPEG
ncbi:hypothetical protein [Parasphingorhabdus cellanae]|uniref:DUF1217 domain-containing protein n=1 Tax=Parasphingorhabdus cellanae TaxID=2806553 RepID=A0ABX7T6K6_9SPHN|nr:hypothetical protein [Parasphingorhabdus cellanae]QTD56147.1 hypothetical protein J4G78_00625 [Parasphingorhabdus cellanae]